MAILEERICEAFHAMMTPTLAVGGAAAAVGSAVSPPAGWEIIDSMP